MPEGWRRWLPGAFLLAAIVCALLMILWIEPKVLNLRQHITDFSEATKDLPERVEFRKYHGIGRPCTLIWREAKDRSGLALSVASTDLDDHAAFELVVAGKWKLTSSAAWQHAHRDAASRGRSNDLLDVYLRSGSLELDSDA